MNKQKAVEINFDKERLVNMMKENPKELIVPVGALSVAVLGISFLTYAAISSLF